MSFRTWRSRESLLKLARKLRLKVQPAASEQQIIQLIANSKVRDWQLLAIQRICERVNREIPKGLNYGRATDIIEVDADILNTEAIDAMKMVSGDVYFWNNMYFLVLEVLGTNKRHMVRLQRVTLRKRAGETILVPYEQPKWFHPMSMYLVALRIDPHTWDPRDAAPAPRHPLPPQAHDDNPF